MKKNILNISLIAVLTIAMFSVIAFVLPFEKNAVFWVAYGVGLLAVLVHLFVAIIVFGKGEIKSIFFGFPIAKIGFAYMIVQVILSIIFMACSELASLRLEIVFFALIFFVAAVGLITINATKSEILRQDENLKASTENMQRLRSMVYPLAGQIEDKECKKILNDIADAFRYSDPVSKDVLEYIENELAVQVYELQKAVIDTDTENVKALCKKIDVTLTERNRICKLNK